MKTFQQQFSELKAFLDRNGLDFLVAVMIAVSAFCGTFGIVCEWMYLAHAAIFGAGIDSVTLLKKTLSAQFVWTPLCF